MPKIAKTRLTQDDLEAAWESRSEKSLSAILQSPQPAGSIEKWLWHQGRTGSPGDETYEIAFQDARTSIVSLSTSYN